MECVETVGVGVNDITIMIYAKSNQHTYTKVWICFAPNDTVNGLVSCSSKLVNHLFGILTKA